MEKRSFLRRAAVAAAATAAARLGIAAGAAQPGAESATTPTQPAATGGIERRPLGRTGEKLSVIGFGGIIVMKQTPDEAREVVAEAVDRGVNYFDVAPSYGNAQERLGPALAPHRAKVFLACKTAQRGGAEAEKELEESLKAMRTDHFDLYQLHAITTVAEDVERVFQPGGVMERLVKAREAGKIRFLGFSAHSEEAARAAMDRFAFDTILFPLGFTTWVNGRFGPGVFELARERGMGVLALKAMALQQWPAGLKEEDRKWRKAWYEPMDREADVELALRFTLNLPVTAALPPGHWELFKMALDLAAAGRLREPLRETERERLMALVTRKPVFEKAKA
jgi:aryl-alcohol dehydrogenase-like predicted oxidoreductase